MSRFQENSSGITVQFKIQANASNTEYAGIYGETYKIRLRAKAVGGKANKELINFLAKKLRVNMEQIQIDSGQFMPFKRVSIEAQLDQEQLETLLGG